MIDAIRALVSDPRPIHAATLRDRGEGAALGGSILIASDEGIDALIALPRDALGARRSAFLPRGWADRSAFFLAGEEHAAVRRAIAKRIDRAAIRAHVPAMRAIARDVLGSAEDGASVHETMLAIASRSIATLLFGEHPPDLDGLLAPLARPLAYAPLLRIEAGGRTPWGRFVRALARARSWLRARAGEALPELERELAVDQLVTLLATGREPMAAALAWSLVTAHADRAASERVSARRPVSSGSAASSEARRADRAASARLRDAIAGLGADPTLDALLGCAPLAGAIDQGLAAVAPVPEIVRRIARPITLAGCPIAAGREVIGAIGLAARARPALAFGGGVHRCLGAELARATLAVVLSIAIGEHRFAIEGDTTRVRRRNLVLIPADARLRRDQSEARVVP